MATSSDTSDQNNVKSRRPAESAFKQQRLPAWQPILTAGTVLPTFFVIGIAFIPVGIGLLYFSDEVKEHTIDYTQCVKKGDTITCAEYIKQMQSKVVANQTTWAFVEKCICELDFNLTEDFKAEVYLYYGLSNYYQNHRRYVKSRDDNQLLGRLNLPLSTDCDPFSKAYENNVKKPVAPCGAIANSLFNDTLTLFSKEQDKAVPVLRTGIAWNSDKEIKFRNPDTSAFNGSLKAAFANYTKPANWAKHVWELDLNDPDNNGFQNEDLIVWMRTAALPTFRKLYRRVNHDIVGFRTGLNKGLYMLSVEYNYPVTDFDGTKSFIISTTSLLGGKNPFLGVAYVVVGTLCLLLGIVLLIIHVRCSKRMPTSAETFILDHDSNTGLKVMPNRQKRCVDDTKTLNVQPPRIPTDNDPIVQGAETQKPQSHLKTVNEMPEEKLTGDNLQTHKASEVERFASTDQQPFVFDGKEAEVKNNGDTTRNVPKKLSVIESTAEPSSSAYPRGRSQQAEEPPHSILHMGGAWTHAKQHSTFRINESKDSSDRSNGAKDSREPRESLNQLNRSSRSELMSFKNQASRSELTNLKKREPDELAVTGPSRSELTAAKRRSSISAVKLKISSKTRESKQSETSVKQVSVETLAKTDTASAGLDTSDKATLDSISDETLKPMSSNADKPKSVESENDKVK